MKNLIIILLIIFSQSIFSQEVKFRGVVTDSIGNPLEAASLVSANSDTKAFQGYAITDEKGTFEIVLLENQAFDVKITYMGYQSVIDKIEVKNEDIYKKYTLKVDNQMLEGVEIKYEMPVSIKGDTITYNADSFTTGNEKKLKDVLKKLPGVEVDKDGTVKVEGKEVKKVMIEGKDFFDGDSKLASKNIPADAVKKIQVLRNYNENSQTKRFENNEDSYAINIKLKEGKKNFWFGEVSAGGGIEDRYLLHPKLFYYSPKKTYNLLLDANNIGTVPMTWRDYFKFTGGFSNLLHKGGSSIRMNSNDLGFSLRQNDQAKATTAKFGAFNYNTQASKSLDISGFVIINYDTTDMQTDTNKKYSASNIVENTNSFTQQTNKLAITKLSASYEPSQNFALKYDVLIKKSFTEENEEVSSTLRAKNVTENSQSPFALNQNLEIYKTLTNNNLISFAFQHKYDTDKPLFEAISTDEFFATSSIINLDPQNTFDILQHKKIDNQNFSSLFDYYLILNSKSHLDFSLGHELSLQKYSTFIEQKLDDNSIDQLTDNKLNNDANYTFSDIFLGLHYKVKWHKFIINPGLNFHYYYFNNIQNENYSKKNQIGLLPDLNIRYKINSSKRISFNYQMTNTFSDVSKYIQGYVLSNYNSLKGGNPDLKNVYKHNLRLNFSQYSMVNFSHLFASVNYTRSFNSVKSTTQLVHTDVVSTPINVSQPDENISGHLGYGKRFAKWQYRINASANWSNYYSILNGSLISSTSLSHNYNAKISSNLSGIFNFDIGYKINFSQFDNMQRNTLYITDQPYANLEFNIFKEQMLFKLDYDYYNYRNKENTTHNTYSFIKAKLFYQKKGSKWEFIFSGTNMLNTVSLDKENLNDIYVATSKYYIQPNYWLLTIKYNL